MYRMEVECSLYFDRFTVLMLSASNFEYPMSLLLSGSMTVKKILSVFSLCNFFSIFLKISLFLIGHNVLFYCEKTMLFHLSHALKVESIERNIFSG